MTRLSRKIWIAGIVLFAGGFASANEQVRLLPLERAAAGIVFFPYPAIASTAGVRPVRPMRSIHSFFHYGIAGKSPAALSGKGISLRFDPDPANRQYPQTLSPYSFRNSGKSRNDMASEDDEWHFQANPQLGVNHEHEKGMTFSVHRGF